MKAELQGITRTWLKEGNIFAGALLNETNNLDQDTLAETFLSKSRFYYNSEGLTERRNRKITNLLKSRDVEEGKERNN
jgi:hypothetical protein